MCIRDSVYTMVEELAPNGYLVAESITFKVMQMNDDLVVFIWQDGGWQKSSEDVYKRQILNDAKSV